MKILNIYGQEAWHAEAHIIGNREGLIELRKVIDKAIRDGKAISTPNDCIFASDGEGYQVVIERYDDIWGIAGGKDSFWNKKESKPQYLIKL